MSLPRLNFLSITSFENSLITTRDGSRLVEIPYVSRDLSINCQFWMFQVVFVLFCMLLSKLF